MPLVAPLAVAAAVVAGVPWAPGQNGAPPASQPNDIVITLVTFGVGDDLTEWFGHSALVVDDTRLRTARLYNYGEFAFDATTIPRYVMGHLTFHVGERAVLSTLTLYKDRDRSVLLQELALTPEQRMGIATFLAENVEPDKRDYLYDHYLDNCATKPRDIVDRFSDKALSSRATTGRLTLRGHTRRHVRGVLGVLIDFAENGSIDVPITTWQEAFLPAELSAQVKAAGLVAKETVYFAAPARKPLDEQPANHAWIMLAVGVGGGALAIPAVRSGTRRWLLLHSAVVGAVILGVPGVLATALWLVTEHQVAHGNHNLFTTNPLTFVAGVLAFICFVRPKAERPWRALRVLWPALAVVGVVGVGLHEAGVLEQDVTQWAALALPLLASQALAFLRLR